MRDISQIKVYNMQDVDRIVKSLNGADNSYPLYSAKKTLQDNKAICFSGALVAAYLSEQLGHDPLIMSMVNSNGTAHAVHIYQENGKFGSIGYSKKPGLGSRNPTLNKEESLAFAYKNAMKLNGYQMNKWLLYNLDDSCLDWRNSIKELALDKLLNKKRHNVI